MSLTGLYSRIFAILILLLINYQPAHAIKIGLLTNIHNTRIAASKGGMLIDGKTGKEISAIGAMQVCNISTNGPDISIGVNGKTYSLGTNYAILKTDETGFVFAKKRWYRGKLILYNNGKSLTVINDIDIENYIRGVVPAEMPSKWNIEAHKAQAIAARSYAIANLGKRAKAGYDLKDTPEDQAYGGATSESYKTNKAVEETMGQVLVYGNKIIPAYYHSSSGGATVNSGSVWFKDLPFVRTVPSYDGNLPKRGHGIGMSQHGANNLANYGYNAYQILGYFYQNVKLYKLNVPL